MSRGSRARRRAMSLERQALQTHRGDDWDAPPVSAEARAAEAPVRAGGGPPVGEPADPE